jgi:putative phosphonate metabolism protein
VPDVSSAPRYALYYVPAPDSPLWQFGCAVLGYDAVRGCDVPHATPEGWLADDWRAATAEPRRYGFHATLKAPFRLAEGRTEADLLHAMQAFSAGTVPAPIGILRVATIRNFIALVPQEQGHELLALAAAIVTAFEPFRAPLSAEDHARRRPEALPARERAYLERYGYPYVLDAFRFHMTLSGPLPPERIHQTRKAIETDLLPVVPLPTDVDRIALCAQPSPDTRFRVLATAPFRR